MQGAESGYPLPIRCPQPHRGALGAPWPWWLLSGGRSFPCFCALRFNPPWKISATSVFSNIISSREIMLRCDGLVDFCLIWYISPPAQRTLAQVSPILDYSNT